ncbi:MAG TPA: hypothetical protein VKY85_02840 [Candidatus Angelobacter sp.]|nr:hypothetical protein [Candidatus Angelobacter sp.]
MDLSFVHDVVAMFQQYQPWMAEKLGGALVSQTLKGLWEQVKAKLGSSATDKIEKKPDDPSQWEVFKAKLLVALDEDTAFQKKIRDLAEQHRRERTNISQQATGTDIRQVAVDRSKDLKISVK